VKRFHGILPFLVGVLVTLACATYVLKPDANRGRDKIGFSHERHAKAKLDCATCHDTVYDATDLKARHLPPEKKCLECHKEQKANGNCAFCHSDVRFAGPWEKSEPQLSMSHAKHIELVKEDCTTCHLQLPEPGKPAAAPPMGTCLNCHQHHEQYASGTCTNCHLDLTRFPLKPISYFSHEGNFTRNHSGAARSSTTSCVQCHDQNFCQDCHAQTVPFPIEVMMAERVDRNFIHRPDFLSRHSIEARADEALCRRCHGTNFCISCHNLQNLTSASSNPKNPHPLNWNTPGSADFHGRAARNDIVSCVACHEQGSHSNCVNCHRVGGIGGNPHPPGWTGRHGHDEIARNSMCSACH